ncbi:hypothetical protein LINGRAHAP2_LOCUS547 [Linum grandiflorum]
MFCFNNPLDVRRVMDEGPWNLDGLLLVTHELRFGEQRHQAPLNTAAIWLQVHDLPFDYFSKTVGRALGNYPGQFLLYDEKNTSLSLRHMCGSACSWTSIAR